MPPARPAADRRMADLVAAGQIRFAVFPPQYGKDAGGALTGPWVEVMQALAKHVGVPARFTELASPDRLIESLAAGLCDVGSLGFDPARAAEVGGFTPPFMQVDYTYLVAPGSAIHTIAEADQPAIRIAAVRQHASTLALERMLQHATPVHADSPEEAFELLRAGRVDAWASIRPVLSDRCQDLPGARVLAESYGANRPALVVAKGHAARLAAIGEFIAEAKASGLLCRIIERVGQPGTQPAA
uniref:Putative ABC-type transporter periplasmic component n=1 Tax=uncultured bacterium B7P37metaSE TaxID=670783 RepID=C8CIK9_9BACT|nr:putative ABC-type transporter periplasmic component [uncultured bacterium B7P37metaSE]